MNAVALRAMKTIWAAVVISKRVLHNAIVDIRYGKLLGGAILQIVKVTTLTTLCFQKFLPGALVRTMYWSMSAAEEGG